MEPTDGELQILYMYWYRRQDTSSPSLVEAIGVKHFIRGSDLNLKNVFNFAFSQLQYSYRLHVQTRNSTAHDAIQARLLCN